MTDACNIAAALPRMAAEAPDRIAMARDWARLHRVQVPPPLR